MKITITKIKKEVSDYFKIREEDLVGNSHEKIYAQPRMIAMFLCRKMTEKSTPSIGIHFKRDHTTVCHAEKMIAKRIKTDPDLSGDVEQLIRIINRLVDQHHKKVKRLHEIEQIENQIKLISSDVLVLQEMLGKAMIRLTGILKMLNTLKTPVDRNLKKEASNGC